MGLFKKKDPIKQIDYPDAPATVENLQENIASAILPPTTPLVAQAQPAPTYITTVKCSNCNEEQAIEIQKGKLVDEELDKFVCTNCGTKELAKIE